MKKETKVMIAVIVITALLAFLLMFTIKNSTFIGKVFANVDDTNATEEIKNCLRSKDIVLYTEPNDLQVMTQLDLISAYLDSIKMVDCSRFPDECNGIVIYPSWKIDNKILIGSLSPGVLVSFSKC